MSGFLGCREYAEERKIVQGQGFRTIKIYPSRSEKLRNGMGADAGQVAQSELAEGVRQNVQRKRHQARDQLFLLNGKSTYCSSRQGR
jgi:hypothetical protein